MSFVVPDRNGNPLFIERSRNLDISRGKKVVHYYSLDSGRWHTSRSYCTDELSNYCKRGIELKFVL